MSTTQRITSPSQRRSFVRRTSVVGSAAALLIVCVAGSASAATGETSSGSTVGNVRVNTSIALTGLTSSFLLEGIPGATASENGLVTVNVETNNLAGYAVTVQSQTATLVNAAVGNTDSIPIGALSVRETNLATPGAFQPLSSTGTVTVHSQSTRSAEGGDLLSNDYSVDIPFVNEDTYSATLDYIATTL